ncbi:hypothetical protein ACFQJC_02290 [Haloferax namakaokahaiae]|uniref:Uncharacterized protein n=1 Tax=Haloferax namakaokahaiae TaxID=1748331 RepID=A0ABD5ZBB8_9EURY
MGLKSTLGNAFASLLLLSAGGLTLWGLWLLVESLWVGVTEIRILAVMFSFGLAMSTGFTGYFIRKALAGQVMPTSFDRSIAYRGGQGGL